MKELTINLRAKGDKWDCEDVKFKVKDGLDREKIKHNLLNWIVIALLTSVVFISLGLINEVFVWIGIVVFLISSLIGFYLLWNELGKA